MKVLFELTELTGCSVKKAVDALNASKGDLQLAVEYVLRDGKTDFNKVDKENKNSDGK